MKISDIDEETFNKYMEDVDAELIEEDCKIQLRPLLAFQKIEKKLKIRSFFTAPIYLVRKQDDLALRINTWYERFYGKEKLSVDFSCGEMIFVLRGVPYKASFPVIFGTVNVEPLKHIENITKDVISKANNEELANQNKLYCYSLSALMKYDNYARGIDNSPVADLVAAVDIFFHNDQSYGLSKWESLQFTEKILKNVLRKNGIRYAFGHSLQKLSNLLKKQLKIETSSELLEKVQCSAEVRYNASSVSKEEALKAHYASLYILIEVMNQVEQ